MSGVAASQGLDLAAERLGRRCRKTYHLALQFWSLASQEVLEGVRLSQSGLSEQLLNER